MWRLVLATWVVALTGCRCEPVVMPTTDERLVVTPVRLDFPDTFVGGQHTLKLEARNPNRRAAHVTLEFTPPFSGPAELEVGGGERVMLDLTFAPLVPGEARATLELDGTVVDLRGLGLDPLQCEAQACRETSFDAALGRCVSSVLPDDTACELPCVSNGRCVSGECLGSLLNACNSNDACVIDGCNERGCVHVARECPVADPCQAVFCDRVLGCQSEPIADGTPCGESTCETAKICLAGRCEERGRPNALQHCRYSELVSGDATTCALSLSGEVRCWGGDQPNALGRGFSSYIAGPAPVPGVSNALHLALDQWLWVADTSGQVFRVGQPARAPLPAAGGLALANSTVCGLEQQTVWCSADGGGFVAAEHVSHLSGASRSPGEGELCVVIDGEARCGAPAALVPLAVPRALQTATALERGYGCGTGDGEVWCWSNDGGVSMVFDAGASVFAGRAKNFEDPDSPLDGWGCAAIVDSGVECFRYGVRCGGCTFPSSPARVPFSEQLGSVRQLSAGWNHACALLEDGSIWCWGSNHEGQLGDRSGQPRGLQELSVRSSWLGPRAELAFDDGGVFRFGLGSVSDAGVTWAEPLVVPIDSSIAELEGRCEPRDAGVFCGELGPLPIAGGARFVPYGLGVCASEGQVARCFKRGAMGITEGERFDAGAAIAGLVQVHWEGEFCALRADGVVRCLGSRPPGQRELVSDVEELCAGDDSSAVGSSAGQRGCARLRSGAVKCWGDWVGSPLAVTPSGVFPFVSQLVCGSHHFCTASGANIVQCWGDNTFGQLGRDGPASTQAVPVPMSEPVQRLAASAEKTCALLRSGKVVCWGTNHRGQLGVPSLTESSRPLRVSQ